LAVGESIRLTAVSEVLGVACIYHDAAKRGKPVTAKRAAKTVRAGDKRLNRRAPVIDDVPDALRPIVARLDTGHPERNEAIQALEAARGSIVDGGGIATRLAALVAQADHQDFVNALAAKAADSGKPADIAANTTDVAPTPSSTTKANPTESRRVIPSTPTAASGNAITPRTDSEIERDVAAVTNFCSNRRWAVIQRNGRYSLKPLDKRSDINAAFNRVTNHPAMQDALAQIYISQPPSAS
jgi:hypothetical protein